MQTFLDTDTISMTKLELRKLVAELRQGISKQHHDTTKLKARWKRTSTKALEARINDNEISQAEIATQANAISGYQREIGDLKGEISALQLVTGNQLRDNGRQAETISRQRIDLEDVRVDRNRQLDTIGKRDAQITLLKRIIHRADVCPLLAIDTIFEELPA